MMILINNKLSTDRGYFSGLPGQSVSSASVSVNKELKMKQQCDKCKKETESHSLQLPEGWNWWFKMSKGADLFQGWSALKLCNSCEAPPGFTERKKKVKPSDTWEGK